MRAQKKQTTLDEHMVKMTSAKQKAIIQFAIRSTLQQLKKKRVKQHEIQVELSKRIAAKQIGRVSQELRTRSK